MEKIARGYRATRLYEYMNIIRNFQVKSDGAYVELKPREIFRQERHKK